MKPCIVYADNTAVLEKTIDLVALLLNDHLEKPLKHNNFVLRIENIVKELLSTFNLDNDITSSKNIHTILEDVMNMIDPELFKGYHNDVVDIFNSWNTGANTDKQASETKGLQNASAEGPKRDFLYNAFKEVTVLRDLTVNEFREKLFKAIVVDLENETYTKNKIFLNKNIRLHQTELFETVKNYLLQIDAVLNNATSKEYLETAELYDTTGNYAGYFGNEFRNIADAYLSDNSATNLMDWMRNEPNKLKAYKAYFTLKNYDNLLRDLWGDAIGIVRRSLKFQKDKYTIKPNKAVHGRTSWNTEEITPQLALNDITRLFIETMPMYRYGSDLKIGNRRMDTRIDEAAKAAIHELHINDENIFTGRVSVLALNYLASKGITNYEQLKAAIPNDPAVLIKIQMDLLCGPNGLIHGNTTKWNSDTKNAVYSIYKSVFADRNSLYSVSRKTENDINLYMYYVSSMLFTKPRTYTETVQDKDTGNIKVVKVNNKRGDLAAKELGRALNAKLGYTTPINYNTLASNYKTEVLEKGQSRIFLIHIPVTRSTDMLIKVDLTKSETEFTLPNKLEKNNLQLWLFCEQVLLIKFLDGDLLSPYATAFIEQYESKGAALLNLLYLASNAYLNSYFTNVVVPLGLQKGLARNKSVIELQRSKLFSPVSKLPGKIAKGTADINIVGESTYNTLTLLARAIDIVSGTSVKSVVSTAEGSDISKYGITTLLDTMTTRLHTRAVISEDSPLQALSILRKSGMMDDVLIERNADIEGIVKANKRWTPSEDFMLSFLYEYLEPLYEKANPSFYIADISDKTQRPSILVDSLVTAETSAINPITQRPAEKRLLDMNVPELKHVINTEFGAAYKGSIENIDKDYRLLNEYIKTNLDKYKTKYGLEPFLDASGKYSDLIIFDVYNNFTNLNEVLGNKVFDFFNEVTRDYNLEHPTKPINFTERAHYMIGKKDGKSVFRANRLLFAQASRYGGSNKNLDRFWSAIGDTYINSEAFWEVRKRELVDDLLRTGCEIFLGYDPKQEKLLDKSDRKGIKKYEKLVEQVKLGALIHLLKSEEWVNEEGYLIITKLRNKLTNEVINVTRMSDLVDSEGRYIRDLNGNNYLNSSFDIASLNGYEVLLHPEIEKFNLLDTLATQNFILSSVGSAVFHDVKGNSWHPNQLLEEGAAVNAQNKRNVIITATLKKFIQNSLRGIPSKYNVALVRDLRSFIYTIDGTETDCKPFDGATFVEPFVNYLENNSLEGDSVGHVKKPIGLDLDDRILNDKFLKTASFPLTNQSILQSEFNLNMMRKMTDHVWRDESGNILNNLDITKGYSHVRGSDGKLTGIYLDYLTSYFRNNGDVYLVNIIEKIDNNNNLYKRRLVSETTGEETYDIVHIQSNYELWKAYGGEQCVEKIENGTWKTSEQSIINVVEHMMYVGAPKTETISFEGKPLTQSDIYQPLKHSDIHYVITEGAMKNGAMNVNEADFYTNNKDYNFGTMSTQHLGPQLDAQHDADAAEVSLMTLVMSALASRGYTGNLAHDAYKALGDLTTNEIKLILDQSFYINNAELTTELRQLKIDLLSVDIAQSILQEMSTGSKSDVTGHIIRNLIEKLEKSKKLSIEDIRKGLPYSDGSILNFLQSTVSSSINKTAIKLKFFGGLDVLNPSLTIMKTYAGRMLSDFKSKHEIKLAQQELDLTPIILRNLLELGKTYSFNGEVVTIEGPRDYWKYSELYFDTKGNLLDKSTVIRELIYRETDILDVELGGTYSYIENGVNKIETINSKWDFSHNITYSHNGLKVNDLGFYEKVQNGTITNVKKVTLYGKELGAYNIKFKSTDGASYSIWDLTTVKLKYELSERIKNLEKNLEKVEDLPVAIADLRKAISEATRRPMLEYLISYELSVEAQREELKSAINQGKKTLKFLQKKLLEDLFCLSKHNPNPKVLVDGKYVEKQTVKVGNGLDVQIDTSSIDHDLYEIIMPMSYKTSFGLELNDSLYEISKDKTFFVKRSLDKLKTTLRPEYFDVLIYRSSGDHLYLVDASRFDINNFKGFTKVDIEISKEKNKYFRVDDNNNIIEQLANDTDSIYVDRKGNEIIVTNDINHYILHTDHFGINLSPNLKGVKNINETYFAGSKYTLKNVIGNNIHSAKNLLMDMLNKGVTEEGIKQLKDTNPSVYRLYKLGIDMHTSFMKSLEVVAARIPSQSLQSFMGMKVVGFTGLDINNAYVSKWLIFLQGSDYDIDKVTLLNSCFGKNGQFVKWSPFFRMESISLLHNSEHLPFPNGKNSVTLAKADYNATNVKEILHPIMTLYKNALEQHLAKVHVKGKINYKNVSGIADVLNTVNKYSEYVHNVVEEISELSHLADSNILPELNKLNKKIVELIVNEHNLYLNSKAFRTEEALKNFLVARTLHVSKDAANVLESLTSVDAVTKPLKDRAKYSQFGQKDIRNGVGNWFSKALAKFTNMQGKDGIAITASLGMKTFYALSAYYNYVLENLPHKARNLLFENVVLGDESRKLLRNAWIKNPEKYDLDNEDPLIREVANALKMNYEDVENVALVLSGVMTLATDNAKELQLSKLNAGPETLGMYLYGIIRGMSFNEIADVLTSNTAKVISDLMRSNVFTKESGLSMKLVFEFLKDPKDIISSYDNSVKKSLGFVKREHKNGSASTAIIKSMFGSFLYQVDLLKKAGIEVSPRNLKKVLFTKKFNAIEDISNADLRRKANKRIDLYLESMLIISEENSKDSETSKYTKLDKIKELYYGANELKRLSNMLGLNMGLKVKLEDKFKFLSEFKGLINDRLIELDRPTSKDTDLDIESFVVNAEYRNAKILKYNEIKHTFPVLDVLWTVPLYRSYLKALYVDIVESKKSAVFREMYDNFFKVAKTYKYVSQKDRNDAIKRMNRFLQTELIDQWLLSRLELFMLPKGAKVYEASKGSGNNYHYEEFILNKAGFIQLGTNAGNEAFVEWMHNEVIPNIKMGIFNSGGKDSTGIKNEFIDNLEPVRSTYNIGKVETVSYTLRGDLSERNADSVDLLNRYESEFSKLRNYKYTIDGTNGYLLSDLFTYYNFIVYKNMTSKDSLTKVLRNTFKASSEIFNSYKKFVATMDDSGKLLPESDGKVNDTLLKAMAPEISIHDVIHNRKVYPYATVWDGEALRYRWLKKKTSSKGELGDEISDEEASLIFDSLEYGEGNNKLSDYYSLDSYFMREKSKYQEVGTALNISSRLRMNVVPQSELKISSSPSNYIYSLKRVETKQGTITLNSKNFIDTISDIDAALLKAYKKANGIKNLELPMKYELDMSSGTELELLNESLLETLIGMIKENC